MNAHDYLYYMRSAFYRSSHIGRINRDLGMDLPVMRLYPEHSLTEQGNRYFDEKGNVLNGNKDNTAVWVL